MGRKKLTKAQEAALLDTAIWWRDWKATNNIRFQKLIFDQHRYLVLMGGGGSGKSIFAGRKLLERVTTEPGHRFLVCRKVARTLRNSCFDQLRGQLAQYYPDAGAKVNKSDLAISFPNGNEIIFAGLDDVEKLKSIYNITGIWIEEASEVTEDDFDQLDIRMRGESRWYQQILISFNPISINHWLKRRFFDRKDPRARTHRSTYKDNRFLPQKDVETLEAFKETNPYYYQVYCLGQWGVTGKTVFDAQKLSERLQHIPKPVKTGYFTYDMDEDGVHIGNIRWEDDKDGPVKVYREPEKGRPYVFGGDTAGEGSDWFVVQGLDNITGEQVCTLRHQYDEDTYARQVFCLGRYYNDALLGVEANYSTYPVKLLDLMGYRNLYVREVEDDYDGRIRHAFGFRTDRLTRPVILSELIRIMREHTGALNDEDTILEMLTFVRNPDNPSRAEAEPGAHDDCVMALAIAYYIRPQQTMQLEGAPEKAEAHWTQDMWDDFNRATQEEREMLLRLWGKPAR